MDWNVERYKVKTFCKQKMYEMIKFPMQIMLEFDDPMENMSRRELCRPEGIICREVIKQIAGNILDKRKWWESVKNVCMRAIA